MTETAERSFGNSAETESMGCHVDFGDGKALELDYRKADGPWLSSGPGIEVADIWFKGKNGLPDLRIHIARTPDGLQVQIDRGQQSDAWWPSDAPPKLKIVFDQGAELAHASASVGRGDDFQEVLLGDSAF